MKDIIYREYRNSDFKELLRITKENWKYDKYLSERASNLSAELDILSYLEESTFAFVAQCDDKLAGFIIGRDTSILKESQYSQMIKKIKRELFFKKDSLFLFYFRNKISRINKNLLKSCESRYPAELQFFVTDKEFRNLGIGKRLLKEFENYLKSREIADFYFYTDSTCNWEFYDRNGYKRRKIYKYKNKFKRNLYAEFYLYDNK